MEETAAAVSLALAFSRFSSANLSIYSLIVVTWTLRSPITCVPSFTAFKRSVTAADCFPISAHTTATQERWCV